MDRAENLRRMIERASEDLAKLEAIPDPAGWPVETVVMWKESHPARQYGLSPFEPKEIVRTYVAIQAHPDHWHLTGVAYQGGHYEHSELRDILAGDKVSEVWIVETWSEIVNRTPATPATPEA